MKLAILNLTSTPIKEDGNVNSTEIINICKAINDTGHNCVVVNSFKEEQKSTQLDLWSSFNLSESTKTYESIYYKDCTANEFDAILLMNSHPNFFGGVKDDITIEKFQWLAKSVKPIYYLFLDRNLQFEQLWKQIANRSWNDLAEADVKITAPIYMISQFSDVEESLRLNNKDGNMLGGTFIDLGVWITKDYKSKFIENKKVYDLIYGGSFRGGRREAKFRDFFFNKSIDVAIFGTMKLSHFKDQTNPPKNWLGKVNCEKVIEEDSLGFATVIVGEKGYNNNINTLRQYESIFANCITFIDEDYDKFHKTYNNDFLYVKSGKELEDKIIQLKSDKNLYDQCIKSQLEFIERKAKIDYAKQIIDYILETNK